MPANVVEPKHTIALIRELDSEIAEAEAAIQKIMDVIQSPITTIPGIGTRMAAMILAEVGDFSNVQFPGQDPRLRRPVTLNIPVGPAYQLLLPHWRETRFQIPSLCHFQRHQVRLHLGSDFYRIPRQKASRGQALQCSDLPRSQEACAADRRH